MKDELEASTPDAAQLLASSRRAQQGMARWLSYVPAEDVRRVDALLGAVRRADTDRDGRLSASELHSLSEEQQRVWTARVSLVGE